MTIPKFRNKQHERWYKQRLRAMKKGDAVNFFGDRCPKNAAEAEVWHTLTNKGWRVTKRGWPDFIAYKNGKIRVVEVKLHRGRRLKQVQRMVMKNLARHGIEVYRYDPDDGLVQLYTELTDKWQKS
jgi:hypothetical protein